MAAPKKPCVTFRDVALAAGDEALLVGADADGARLFSWTDGGASMPLPLAAIGLCFVDAGEASAILALAADGQVLRVANDGTVATEIVDASRDGPQNLGGLSEIRTIAGCAHVVGLRRTVYRCDAPGAWTRLDRGMRCDTTDITDAGLNSIDGFAADDLYAVGWDGELWRFDGNVWAAAPSPTDRALFRVVCAPDGVVYASGQGGLLLKGRGDDWALIEHQGPKKDVWGAVWFKERLIFAAADGLFSLAGGEVTKLKVKLNQSLISEFS